LGKYLSVRGLGGGNPICDPKQASGAELGHHGLEVTPEGIGGKGGREGGRVLFRNFG
jgi:hypothetical protein